MRIVDAEVHLLHKDWQDHLEQEPHIRRALRDHPDFPSVCERLCLDALIRSMDSAGIERAQILGVPWLKRDNNLRNNEALFRAAETYPDRFAVYPVWDISQEEDAIDWFSSLRPERWHGVKIVGGWQGIDIASQEIDGFCRWLAEQNKPLFVHVNHLGQGDRFDTPQKFLSLVERHPTLRIFAAHMGGMLFAYEGYPPVARKLRNVVWVTSVSATMYMVSHAMQLCPRKVVFGTDFPFNHCHNQTDQTEWIRKHFSQMEQEWLFSSNLEDFLG